jgi:hypothetical protein
MKTGFQKIKPGLIENYPSLKCVILACIFPGDGKSSGNIFGRQQIVQLQLLR